MGKPSAASARGRKSRVLRATRKVFVATAHAVGVEAAQAFAEAFQHRDGAFDGLVAKALSVSSPAASRTVSETIDLIDLRRTVLLDDASDGEAEAVGPEVHGGQKLIHAARDDGCKSGPIIDTSCDSPQDSGFLLWNRAWRAHGVIHASRFCRTLRLQHVSRKRHDFEVKPHALFMYGIWYDHTPARRALAAESRVVAAQIQRTRAGDGGKSHDSPAGASALRASSAPTWTSSSRSGFPASRSSSASRPTWLARTA